MSWTSLYIDYKNTGTIHKCPECGKDTVSVETIHNSITFSCKSCGKFKHYDEAKNTTSV